MFLSLLEGVILAAGCSLDAFAASFAYGTKKIRIPFLSNQIINFICSGILGMSLLMGAYIRQFLPAPLTRAICLLLLTALGVAKVLDSATKSIIRRHNKLSHDEFNREIKFSMFNFRFILHLYANPLDADIDSSKDISSTEAAALAASLSLDGLAAGIGAAFADVNILAVFLASLVTNMVAVALGCLIGNKLAVKTTFDLGWVSGIILICLGVMKGLQI